jgi:hypothetical protein
VRSSEPISSSCLHTHVWHYYSCMYLVFTRGDSAKKGFLFVDIIPINEDLGPPRSADSCGKSSSAHFPRSGKYFLLPRRHLSFSSSVAA